MSNTISNVKTERMVDGRGWMGDGWMKDGWMDGWMDCIQRYKVWYGKYV